MNKIENISNVAIAVVFNVTNGTVLFQKRLRRDDNLLYLPGGKINDGEDSREAIIRELEEETGIRKYEKINYIFDTPHESRRQDSLRKYLFHVYLCEISDTRQVRNREPHKHTLRFVPLEEAMRERRRPQVKKKKKMLKINPKDLQILKHTLKSI